MTLLKCFTTNFLDDAMGDEDDEDESEAIVSQVLDELGLQLTDQMTGIAVPTGSLTVAAKDGKTPVPAGMCNLINPGTGNVTI